MKWLKLFVALIISFSAATIGSLATTSNIPTWYATLEKPFFNPPNWLFGPVWTLLYCLIGISLWLVWIQKSKQSKLRAYIAFGVQIALNTLWSLVFFGLHLPELGVVIIIAMLCAIGWNIYEFKKFSKTASFLLIPYILWVSFATLLTVAIAVLN